MDVVQDEQWFRLDFTPNVAGRGKPVGILELYSRMPDNFDS